VPWFGATPGGTSEALNTVETLTISFIVFIPRSSENPKILG
jgi:hypothetical protein